MKANKYSFAFDKRTLGAMLVTMLLFGVKVRVKKG